MNTKKIAGIVLVIAGVVLLGISHYIDTQVAEGKIQVSEGQQKVNTANSIFSMTSETREVGKAMTSGAQREINEGRGQISHYEQVANTCQFAGIACIIVGAIVFFMGMRKSR